jgi:hypothetical protein
MAECELNALPCSLPRLLHVIKTLFSILIAVFNQDDEEQHFVAECRKISRKLWQPILNFPYSETLGGGTSRNGVKLILKVKLKIRGMTYNRPRVVS